MLTLLKMRVMVSVFFFFFFLSPEVAEEKLLRPSLLCRRVRAVAYVRGAGRSTVKMVYQWRKACWVGLLW